MLLRLDAATLRRLDGFGMIHTLSRRRRLYPFTLEKSPAKGAPIDLASPRLPTPNRHGDRRRLV